MSTFVPEKRHLREILLYYFCKFEKIWEVFSTKSSFTNVPTIFGYRVIVG